MPPSDVVHSKILNKQHFSLNCQVNIYTENLITTATELFSTNNT